MVFIHFIGVWGGVGAAVFQGYLMIWIWVRNFLTWVGRMVIPPPPGAVMGIIDPNTQCPACGNRSGKLQFVLASFPIDGKVMHPMVQHTCGICSFQWCSLAVGTPKYPVQYGADQVRVNARG